MNMKKLRLLLIGMVLLSVSCDPATKWWNEFNLFPVEQDLQLGLQVSQQIESDPQNFPILPEAGNREIYQYIRSLTNKILATGKVKHRDAFAWQVKIIDDDETLNAFCTPGGFIYVYTGLIKFLDTESQLAGVMGHEIAHADLRHSTAQMTKLYGLDIIRQLITKNADPSLVEQVALQLTSLSFSRYHESQSDLASVEYLCGTNYNAAGAAGFFQKMKTSPRPPQFLSTHPDPANRVEAITGAALERNCDTTGVNTKTYDKLKQRL